MQSVSASKDGDGTVVTWQPNVVLGLLLVHFVLFGCIAGAKGVVWADLLRSLNTGTGPFGTAQILPPLVSMGLLLWYAPLSARIPARWLIIIGLVLHS